MSDKQKLLLAIAGGIILAIFVLEPVIWAVTHALNVVVRLTIITSVIILLYQFLKGKLN